MHMCWILLLLVTIGCFGQVLFLMLIPWCMLLPNPSCESFAQNFECHCFCVLLVILCGCLMNTLCYCRIMLLLFWNLPKFHDYVVLLSVFMAICWFCFCSCPWMMLLENKCCCAINHNANWCWNMMLNAMAAYTLLQIWNMLNAIAYLLFEWWMKVLLLWWCCFAVKAHGHMLNLFFVHVHEWCCLKMNAWCCCYDELSRNPLVRVWCV